MNSDAIKSKRILGRKQCLFASSNNSLTNTKFSNINSKLTKKIIIKAKRFLKLNESNDFLTIKKLRISDNPNTRKKKSRLKIRKNKERNFNNFKINCDLEDKNKILNEITMERKQKRNDSYLGNLPVIK